MAQDFATPTTPTGPVAGSFRLPAPARDADKAKTGAAGILFLLYLLVFLIEYTGLSKDVPILKQMRFTTVASYLLLIAVLAKFGLKELFRFRQTKIFFGFIVFTMLSVIWAVVSSHAFESIRPFVDYTVFFILTVYLFDRRSRFDLLSWLCVAVAATVVIRSLPRLGSEVRAGSLVAGYFMGDGNDFAWGLVFMLPLILNLVLGKRSLLVRAVGVAGVGLCVIGIVGSGSRGGTLGLAAALFYYWLAESRYKARGLVAIAVVAFGVLLFAPQTYFNRMGSVGHYENDSSAQARLQTWGAGLRMGIGHPLGVGAGNFSSAYGRYYMPGADANRIAWAPQRWLSAHSIYFRTLGEYGFLGLWMLLLLLWTNLRMNFTLRQKLRADPEAAPVVVILPSLVNMSIVGFAVCGIFLGGLTYPHIFVLSGLTIAMARLSGASSSTTQANAPLPRRAR